MSLNQSKTLTFEADVAQANLFSFGETRLINTALVYNERTSNSIALTIKVQKSGVAGATDISTGPLNPFTISLVGAIILGLLMSYISLLKFYVNYHVLPENYQVKSNKDLTKAIEKIRKQRRI